MFVFNAVVQVKLELTNLGLSLAHLVFELGNLVDGAGCELGCRVRFLLRYYEIRLRGVSRVEQSRVV